MRQIYTTENFDKNKYVEDSTDAFYFVDAFQEVMFDAYFLKE